MIERRVGTRLFATFFSCDLFYGWDLRGCFGCLLFCPVFDKGGFFGPAFGMKVAFAFWAGLGRGDNVYLVDDG